MFVSAIFIAETILCCNLSFSFRILAASYFQNCTNIMELSIQHLSKTYPNGVTALNDVTFTISSGMYGLLGPNGAGKSTLMRTIATLQDADSGSITLDEL